MILKTAKSSATTIQKGVGLLLGVLIFTSVFAIGAIYMYHIKPADKHLIFYANGFQETHYYVLRENISSEGYVNVTHIAGRFNASLDIWNIKDFSVDLTSLCDDEGTDDLFFADELQADYCYNFLLQGGQNDLYINSSDNVNLSFINVPEPYEMVLDGVVVEPGNFSIHRHDENWTWDETNETVHTQLTAGDHTVIIRFYTESLAAAKRATGLMFTAVIAAMFMVVPLCMLKMMTRMFGKIGKEKGKK